MTEQDRSDWSLSIVVSCVCIFFSVVLMVVSLHLHYTDIRRCEEVEEHLVEVQKQSERLQREMIAQQEIFAGIMRDVKENW
ncbi:MAG: hypothetical protein J6Y78_09110 [Paludibacteraceae bacterium]|nr:hypothetical protein [Paludibacteraceae bacterium]